MEEKFARILAVLYPDRRPSEIRKIMDDALAKEPNPDDVELWMTLAKAKTEKSEPAVLERIIERHHYHDWYHPYGYNSCETVPADNITITCNCNDNTWTSFNDLVSTEATAKL